jgi:hypothetical protein
LLRARQLVSVNTSRSLESNPYSAIITVVCRWFEPVDAASLVAFRIAFGILMCVEVIRFFAYGWIDRYFIVPTFHFTYFGFWWVRPWAGPGMHVHFAALGILALFVAAGIWYRASAALFFFGFTHVFLLDQARYLNHFYLVCLLSFVLVFVPAHRSFSVDAWRRSEIRSDVVPAWAVTLLRAQIGIPYFYAGVAKLNTDWMAGNPLRGWLAAATDFPVLGSLFVYEPIVTLFAFGALLFDLLVVPLLMWHRTRPVGFSLAVMFHAMNWRLFHIGIFPPLMIAATCLFFDPDWPRRIWQRVRPSTAPPAEQPTARGQWWSRSQFTTALVAFYLIVQVAVPLRHFLYPGDVNWTEEGHRFSWHMMLREKTGDVEFVATQLATGATFPVDPHAYLTSSQIAAMNPRPDMILQFCHWVADDLSRTMGPVEIRVRASLSLNGRPEQLLIDPDVNLAEQPRNLWPAPWIVQLADN